jgi:hypothetical protein
MSRFQRFRAWVAKPKVAEHWPLLGLAVLLAVAYYPIFCGRIIFNRDLSRFVYPAQWFIGDSLRRGDSPWWTPHIGLGHSMLADPQSAIFYPVNLLHLVGSLPFMMNVVCLLHLLWGAAGMVKVARAFHLAHVPALVVGLSWALSGYVASLWTNGARLPSAAWMSWQILACVHLARLVREGKPALRAIAWLALATAAGIVAGDVFVAIMGGMVGLGLAGAWLLGERRACAEQDPSQLTAVQLRATTRGFLVRSFLGAGLGILLAMAALLPAASAIQGTERAGGIPSDLAQSGSLHPMRLVEFAAPEAFSRAWYLAPDQPWVDSHLDGAPLSLSTYLGGSVLALLLLGFAPAGRRKNGTPFAQRHPLRATAGLVAAVGFIFLLLAFGRHTPVFWVFRTLLVPLRYMRAPEKFMLAVIPCVALLAGWGTHRLFEQSFRRQWKWGIVLPTLLLGLALLAPSMLPVGLGDQVQQRAWHGLIAAVLVLAAWAMAGRSTALAGAIILLVVVADLSTGATLTLRFEKTSKLPDPTLARVMRQSRTSPELPWPRLFRGSKVQLAATQSGELDSDQITWETLRDNLSVPLGVDILPGYGVAIPPRFTALLGQGRLDALRLSAVDFALLSAPADSAPVPEGLALLSRPVPGVRLYQLERALPRVFVAFHGTKFSSPELTRHLLDSDVVAGKTILLDEHDSWTAPSGSMLPPAPCTCVHFGNTLVRARCNNTLPGLAVFVEQYAPGWSATVDGAPAPLLKADSVMRAVPVPAGGHLVELSYSPPGLVMGVLLSLLGLCGILALFLAARRQDSRLFKNAAMPPAVPG